MPSVPVMTASGSTMTMPATPTKGGATLMSRIGSVKMWGMEEAERNKFNAFMVACFFTILLFFQSFSNLPFLPSAESQSQDAPDHTPRPRTSMSSFTCELSTSSSYPSTPNGTSSAGDTQHPHTHRFFRASSGTGSPGASSAHPGSSGRDSIGHNKQRRSTSRSWTCERDGDRDVGDTYVGARRPSSSRRTPPVIGSGEWNASRTSLRLAMELHRESVMENSPSSSRPSSPLPLMQGVSERKTRVSYSGRQPSVSRANTQAAAAERTQTPTTPSKIVKKKSLGFVRLGFGGGNTHATEGKCPGLGLGLGRRAADSDEEEDYGKLQQRTRRKSLSKLLLDRDKSKDREDHETPLKEGSRGFMNLVRRISLVGKHKRAQSSDGLGVVPSSSGLSGGDFFNRHGSGGKRSCPASAAAFPPAPPGFDKSLVVAAS